MFSRAKRELANLTVTQKALKNEWEGAVWTVVAADFAEVFQYSSGGKTAVKNASGLPVAMSETDKMQNVPTIISFFISDVQVVRKCTQDVRNLISLLLLLLVENVAKINHKLGVTYNTVHMVGKSV